MRSNTARLASPQVAKTPLMSFRTVYDLADRPTLAQAFGLRLPYLKAKAVPDSASPETLTVTMVTIGATG